MERKHKLLIIGIILVLLIGLGIFGLYRKSISKDFLIMIDPGHGGDDPGTIGVSGVYEKDINLRIARELESKLWKKGYKTIMMREDEETIGVYERAAIANREDVDFYLSLHCNAIENNPDMNGIQVLYYPDEEGKNEYLAQIMMDNIIKTTKAKDMRLVPMDDIIVLTHTKMTALLVEMGFLTNDRECRNLEDIAYQRQMAKGIINSIDEYYKNSYISRGE